MTLKYAMTPNVLTIAGSDSGGGAGIQADLKTFSALGAYGASVITAVTAQNTQTVTAIHDIPAAVIAAQLDAVFSDIRIDAVKIGMLSKPDVIEVVAERLRFYGARLVVLDPVMVAKRGDRLLQPEAVQALVDHLLPLATIITPNLPEAGVLLDRAAPRAEASMGEAILALRALGARAVLLKGGHLEGPLSFDVVDYGADRQRLQADRIDTKNTHGTGCTLSAAIAAFLGQGLALRDAARLAKRYIALAIAAADSLEVGGGHGPVHHFHALWPCLGEGAPKGGGGR
jgi:hydroxymethylpyrimidine/phosphomethylpyrimidine kinase